MPKELKLGIFVALIAYVLIYTTNRGYIPA